MALVVADRVRETTITVGTGAFALGGASPGYQAFSAVMTNGDTTYYACASTTDWEVGVGTWNTGNTLTRTTILASSNSGNAVNFGAGSKDIFISYPASRSVYQNAAGTSTVQDAFATATIGTANITTANITAGTVSTTPASGNDIANKTYVDTMASSGITYHSPVKYEVPNTTGNLNAIYNQPGGPGVGVGATLTNNGTLAAFAPDGPTAAPGDRILVYNQTNAFENGVYTVTTVGSGSVAWVLTRATDADTYGVKSPNALGLGDAFFITSGNTGAGETYVCNTSGTITFGTTAINFVQVSSAQIYSAGTGLTLSGTQFSISNTGVSANTYGSASAVPVIAVNAQGQITTATNTTIAITGAQVSGNIAGSAGSVANALTAGTYLTSGGTFDGSVARTFAVDATSANTASKVVARDASGNFSAGTITATLSGNATSANTATNISGGAANQIPFQASAGTTTFSSSLTFNGVTLTAADIADTSLTSGRVTYAGSGGNLTDSANLTFNGNSLILSGTGSANAAALKINTPTSSTFVHSQENFAANLTSGQHNIFVIGKEGNTKNSGYIGYYWAGAASNSNFVTIGHWGNDDLFRVYGDGNVTVGTNTVLNAGNYNSYAPTLTGGGASGTWAINITGSAGASTSVNATTSTGIQTSYSSTINTTTPGTGTYGINFSGGGTPDYAQGITWAWSSSGSQAGIYVQSSGSYGTKMYLATTDSFATGSRTAISIDHTGLVQTVRNYFQAVGSVRAPIFYDSDNTGYYVDPNGNSYLAGFLNVGNYVQTNAGGVKWDQSGVRSWEMYPTGGYILLTSGDTNGHLLATLTGGIRAPIFYDSNNTGYFVDPASASNFNTIYINGTSTNAFGSYWAGTFGYPGYQFTGGNSRFGFSSTSGYVDVYTDGNYYGGIDLYGANRLVPLFDANQGGGALYSSILYDSNNTGYYADPASTSYLNVVGAADRFYTGYDSGQTNSVSCSNWFRSNGNSGWYNASYGGGIYMIDSTWVRTYDDKQFYSGTVIQAGASVRAPIFYDANDTGYYLDPNSTSDSALRIRGGALHGPNPTWGAYLSVGTNGHVSGSYASVCATNGNLHLDAASGYDMYLNNYAGNNTFIRYIGNDRLMVYGPSNYTQATGSLRAPLFYDSDNTAYYVDPASTSNINVLQVAGAITQTGPGRTSTISTSNYDTRLGSSDLYFYFKSIAGNGSSGYPGAIQFMRFSDGATSWPIVMQPLGGNFGIGSYSADAKLHVVNSTPTSIGALPSGVTGLFDSSGNNYLLFRNTADNGTYSGIAFQDNNMGGYVIFGNAGATPSDQMAIAGYGGGILQYGTADSINPSARTTVASWNSTGLQINNGDMRAPIYYDSNDTTYYVNPASFTNIFGGLFMSGSHGSTQIRNFLPAANNGGGSGIVVLQQWCSEPGITWDWAGFGYNVTNDGGGSYGFSRINTGFGQAYMRMGTSGQWYFYTANTSGTRYTHIFLSPGNGVETYGILYNDTSVRSPIFYDSNNTGYYLDPAATTSLRTVGSWRSDSSSWDGEFAGKIQYHSSIWYFQAATGWQFRNSGGSQVLYCDSSGNLTASGNVTAYSDARIKENVITIDSALSKVLGLRGVYYNKIGNPERRVGVIAQEVMDVLPEVVRSVSDTNPSTGETKELLAVDYGNMVGLLIEAIKEQQSQIKALKAKVNAILAS